MNLEKRISTNKKNLNKKLNLSGLNLKHIPSAVFSLTHLEILVLGDWISESPNRISKIPKAIKNLKRLTSIDLRENLFTEFPAELFELKRLKKLDLTGNQINKLPDNIHLLESIEQLYLGGNNLIKLPHSFNRLKNLKKIELDNNPINSPPFEIAFQGVEAIRNYFYELESEEETQFLNEIKLLLVGEGRVGKTTISKRLSNPEYKFKHETTTEGVNILNWIIPKEELEFNKDFKINIWDFGGQEIYHSTHQFFLTKRSIYLLITESRKEDRHEDFYYWLNTIKILGDKSPIILVMNKCDQPNKEIPFNDYKKVFPSLINFTKVGCKSKEKYTIENLKEEIKNIILDKKLLPHIGNPLPKVWVEIRYHIESRLGNGENYISYENYLEICAKHGMNEERALFLSDYFHDIGVFLHFKDDLSLHDTIFLNHEYITTGVYKVLDNKNVISNNGRFTNSDLIKIWKEKTYKFKKSEMLALMMNSKFELCFELTNGNYLAPQLLPVEAINFNFNPTEPILHFEIQYNFMPKGIVTRFIVKRSNDIHKDLYWRYGVILYYNDTYARIEEDYFLRKITIKISGNDKKTFLEIIRRSFNEIHSTFNNLEITENIPCRCLECQDLEMPHLFKYKVLERYLKKRKTHITCDISLEEVSVKKIINSVMERSAKIFISYSHKDSKWLERINIHLKPLLRNGNIESWDDTKILPGDKWKSEIFNHLSTSNVAILLISADFMASDFIVESELPPILQKAESKGLKVISLIIKPSLFDIHEVLPTFQAFNSPSEPLAGMSESKQEEVLANLAKLVMEIHSS